MASQTIRFVAPAGLTLLATAYAVGSATAFASDVSCTEAARGGIYTCILTSSSGKYEIHLTTGGSKLAVFYVKTTDTAATFDAVDQRVDLEIAEDAETAAAGGGGGGGGLITGLTSSALAQLAGVEIRLGSNNMTDAESLDLVKGCDYDADDGTAKTWTITDTADLSDATATLTLKRGATSQTYTGTVTDTGDDAWEIAIEFTAAQTAALTAGVDWTYILDLNLANGHTRNLRYGQRARVIAR